MTAIECPTPSVYKDLNCQIYTAGINVRTGHHRIEGAGLSVRASLLQCVILPGNLSALTRWTSSASKGCKSRHCKLYYSSIIYQHRFCTSPVNRNSLPYILADRVVWNELMMIMMMMMMMMTTQQYCQQLQLVLCRWNCFTTWRCTSWSLRSSALLSFHRVTTANLAIRTASFTCYPTGGNTRSRWIKLGNGEREFYVWLSAMYG